MASTSWVDKGLDDIKRRVLDMDLGTFRLLCFVKHVVKVYHSEEIEDYFIFIKTVPEELISLWQHDWYYTHKLTPLDVERWNSLSTEDKQLLIKYGKLEYLYLSEPFVNFYDVPLEIINLNVRNFNYNVKLYEYHTASIVQELIIRYGIILPGGTLYSELTKVKCQIKYPLIILQAKVPILKKDLLRWSQMLILEHFEWDYVAVSPQKVLNWLLKNTN